MYNLAGFAETTRTKRWRCACKATRSGSIRTLAAIRARSKKSSQNNTISQASAAWDPDLKTFTVFGWTSTSRNITNPYNLVFSLRPANDQISHKDAKAIWNSIAKSTIKGDDLRLDIDAT